MLYAKCRLLKHYCEFCFETVYLIVKNLRILPRIRAVVRNYTFFYIKAVYLSKHLFKVEDVSLLNFANFLVILTLSVLEN